MIFKFIRDDNQNLILDSAAWGIYDLEGLTEFPEVAIETQAYAFSDGSYWTKNQAQKRPISFKADYRYNDQSYFMHNKVGSFFNHLANYELYILGFDGKDGYLQGKVSDFFMPPQKSNDMVHFEIAFLSVNPFIQSADDFGQNLNTVNPMIHYPRHYLIDEKKPYSVRAFAQNVPITNDGNINAGFVATITFAEDTSTFSIQNSNGEKINIAKAFIAGDVLQIDTKSGVCRLNGTKFYKGVSNDSVFFPLYPGVNYLTYAAAVGESTLDINLYYRSQRMVF